MSSAAKRFFSHVTGGRLFVPAAYYNTTGDTAVQLNAAADWALFGWVQECDMALSSLSFYITAVATEEDLTLALHYADSDGEPDGAAILSIGAVGSGDTADTWIRTTFTSTQLYRNKRYCIVFKGHASGDFSLSARRLNTALGSAHPDGSWSYSSTDSGSSWSQIYQDTTGSALLNVVLNSTTDHVPQLYYGRYTGPSIYLSDDNVFDIPITGISYDCTSLTADTIYYVYENRAVPGLALDCSTTAFTDHDGIKVKTGDNSKRFIGTIRPKDVLGTGDQAPVDVCDSRLILNVHNRRWKSFGKLCPYEATTNDVNPIQAGWETALGNLDYKAEFLADEKTVIPVEFGDIVTSAAQIYAIAYGLDSTSVPYPKSATYVSLAGGVIDKDFLFNNLTPGYHYLVPLQRSEGAITVYFKNSVYLQCNMLGRINV